MTKTDALGWQLAGLTDADGNLDRAVASGQWIVSPHVELDGGRLVWHWNPQQGGARVRPGRNMFAEFVHLADTSDERIMRYARRWGVLFLCRHGVPAQHPIVLGKEFGIASHGECEPLGWVSDWDGSASCWEPVAAWRHYSRHARAILNIVERLRNGKPGMAEDWRALCEWSLGPHDIPGAPLDTAPRVLVIHRTQLDILRRERLERQRLYAKNEIDPNEVKLGTIIVYGQDSADDDRWWLPWGRSLGQDRALVIDFVSTWMKLAGFSLRPEWSDTDRCVMM